MVTKAKNKTVPTKESVLKYIQSIEDPKRRKDVSVIAALMKKVSKEKPVMWGTSIIGFGNITLRPKSGREVDWMLLNLSSRKAAITIGVTCDLSKFKKELSLVGPHKASVGCIYIKSLEGINMKALENLFVIALKRWKEEI